MWKKYALVFFISATLLIAANALSTGFIPKAQAKFLAPDGGCWCTTYVANRYHLPSTYPNAYQWPGWLQKLGWKQDRVPHVGDIGVLQPKIAGANKLYGHVGIVQTAKRSINRKSVTITLQGAYQRIGPQFSNANCRNVSNWALILSMGRHSGVSYFYKPGVSR